MGLDGNFAQQQFLETDVCNGSLADIAACLSDVRFTPESGHQLGFEGNGSTTLYVIMVRRMPLSVHSPTGSTVTAFSTTSRTRGLMRIWPRLASSQSLEATLDTVPIAP